MTGFLAFILFILMVMVVVSLVRGIAAFLRSTKDDLYRDPAAGPSAMQLKQNRMMTARILFQGAAVLLVALLLFATR